MGLSNPEALEANIRLHKSSLEKFVPDIIKIMNDTLMMMPLDVSDIKKASDLYKIKKPMLDTPYAKAQIDFTKRVMEIYEGVDAPVYVTCFSATWVLRNAFTQGLPVFGANEDIMQRFISEDPVAVKYAIDIITEGIIDLNRVLLTECGADCTVPNDIDEERFNIVRDACKKYAACNSVMFSAS